MSVEFVHSCSCFHSLVRCNVELRQCATRREADKGLFYCVEDVLNAGVGSFGGRFGGGKHFIADVTRI